MSIRETWYRIRSWHKKITPPATFRVNRGTTERRLARFEETLGTSVPSEFRDSYLAHNGTGESWLLYHGSLLSLDGILRFWNRYKLWQREKGYGVGEDWVPHNINGPIKPLWWNVRRLPITDNGGGDPVTVDLDPANGGTVGQIIKVNHEVGPTNVLATDIGAWLEEIATGLEAGRYVYSEEGMQVQPTEWDD